MREILIEFVGGPFDGHKQPVPVPRGGLQGRLLLPVNEDIFRVIAGEKPTGTGTTTSFAVYRVEVAGDRVRCRFVGAKSPGEIRSAK